MNPLPERVRALIVDDELLARQRLQDLLAEEPRFEVVGECADGPSAVEAIQRLTPDLVFLDVQMPGLDGFGVVDAIGPDRMPLTLFVTAFDQYALRAFDARALDYLLKPFDTDRFKQALQRVIDWMERRPTQELNIQLSALLDEVTKARADTGRWADRLLVKSGEGQSLIRVADVEWIESEENYVRLHTADGSYLLRQTMAGILQRLDPKQFRRIHRSHIVNLDFIGELQPWFSGDTVLLMKDGTKLTISRNYRDQFEEWR